jgi:hypothetical protein
MSTQPTMTEILPRIEQSIQRVVQAVTALPPAPGETAPAITLLLPIRVGPLCRTEKAL